MDELDLREEIVAQWGGTDCIGDRLGRAGERAIRR
jgi:hypothetical protein